MNYMYMYQGKPHMPPPNTTKPSLQMALHLHVSRTPLVQSTSPPGAPLMIVRCKFKGPMEPSPHSKTTSPHHYCLTNLHVQIIHPHCKQWSYQLSYRWGFQTLHWQQGCPHMQGSIAMMPVEMPAVTLQAIKQSPNFRGSHELYMYMH